MTRTLTTPTVMPRPRNAEAPTRRVCLVVLPCSTRGNSSLLRCVLIPALAEGSSAGKSKWSQELGGPQLLSVSSVVTCLFQSPPHPHPQPHPRRRHGWGRRPRRFTCFALATKSRFANQKCDRGQIWLQCLISALLGGSVLHHRRAHLFAEIE